MVSLTDNIEIKLKFIPKERIVEILDFGNIQLINLYITIKKWEASEEGIAFPVIVESSGNIELSDGSRTQRTIVFLNNWSLSSKEEVFIKGGYVTGRDSQNIFRSPVSSDSVFNIKLLSNIEEESNFIPTEAQKKYAKDQGELFSKDWEVVIKPFPMIQRRENASDKSHSIFGLYWFLKLEWIQNEDVRSFNFPIRGDNQIPRKGAIRHYKLLSPWKINKEDIKYLSNGPLIYNNEIIVKAIKQETETDIVSSKTKFEFINFFRQKLNSIFFLEKRKKKKQIEASSNLKFKTKATLTKKNIKHDVTIGIITALEKEHAAMTKQIDNQKYYVIKNRRVKLVVIIGTIPALNSEDHIIALTMCEMGNNLAAIAALNLQNEFPNLQEIIMVGIAGAIPSPENPENHVRLGDIVVSGREGVIQYDFTKVSKDVKEHRHAHNVPSSQLRQSVRLLESEKIGGSKPWIEALKRTDSIDVFKRPDIENDILMSTDEPPKKIEHPNDPDRLEGEPRIFVGAIGAANILLKDTKLRDYLKEKFNIKAIEMESSGISDAAIFLGSNYFVIRGTCDYCDPEKNNKWQYYAASIAAAYCRVLLEKTPTFKKLI